MEEQARAGVVTVCKCGAVFIEEEINARGTAGYQEHLIWEKSLKQQHRVVSKAIAPLPITADGVRHVISDARCEAIAARCADFAIELRKPSQFVPPTQPRGANRFLRFLSGGR